MTSRFATLVGLTGLVLGASTWGAGCYNPDIKNQLHCATPPAKACPDGYQCSGQLCVKIGAVGSASGGATGSGGMGTGGTGTGGVGTGGARPRVEFESCLPRNVGTPNQTDDCDTGLTCLSDCSSQHCFRGCQTDGECPKSSCTRTFAGNAGKFCELPYTACNPAGMFKTSCTSPLLCTLLSSQPAPGGGDRTVCDCEGSLAARGEPCSQTRDCFGGLVCPPSGSGPGAEFCRVVCDPMLGAAACAAGTCHPLGARWGYCS